MIGMIENEKTNEPVENVESPIENPDSNNKAKLIGIIVAVIVLAM